MRAPDLCQKRGAALAPVRPTLPNYYVFAHGIGNRADAAGRHLSAVDHLQVALDLPDRQAPGVQQE